MSLPHPGNHPTGIAGSLVVVVLLVARQVGLKLSYDEALAIVGLAVAGVSLFTPRTALQITFAPEDPGA